MSRTTILTGVRANNNLHIGNYFGAILPIINMAKTRSSEFDINLFIPDLHSFTTPIDHGGLYQAILQNARVFVAAGLPIDNDAIHLYRQSHISAHSELMWILDCFTGFGEMNRMTQFKDKAQTLGAGRTTVGVFNYPVLMAADILLYGAKYVPVGDDQTQHLEFTRDIAERMNSRFGNLFVIPEPVKQQHEFFGNKHGLRVRDLADPTKKMSKSDDSEKGVIFMSDDPSEAAKKIMSATTDDRAYISYDKDKQAGISNLLEILALMRHTQSGDETMQESLERVIDEFSGQTRYGEFKRVVADEVHDFLTSFQNRLANVDDNQITDKLVSSEQAMRAKADKTLYRVQQAVGLRQKD